MSVVRTVELPLPGRGARDRLAGRIGPSTWPPRWRVPRRHERIYATHTAPVRVVELVNWKVTGLGRSSGRAWTAAARGSGRGRRAAGFAGVPPRRPPGRIPRGRPASSRSTAPPRSWRTVQPGGGPAGDLVLRRTLDERFRMKTDLRRHAPHLGCRASAVLAHPSTDGIAASSARRPLSGAPGHRILAPPLGIAHLDERGPRGPIVLQVVGARWLRRAEVEARSSGPPARG